MASRETVTTTSSKFHPPGHKATLRNPAMSHKKVDPGTGGADTKYGLPPTKATEAEADFTAGLDAFFSMYNEKAARQDQKTAGSWNSNADGVLHATSLLSIMVAIFLVKSSTDLQPYSQHPSWIRSTQICQFSTSHNGSFTLLPSSSSDSSTFSPPASAVWVNTLWSLSLVASLTCVLFASLLQQWAHRYLHVTQGLHNSQKRVRIRELMAQGVEKYHLPWVASALPPLFHISIFLFLAGHVIFLSGINHTVFMVVFTCVATCAALYLCFILSPILLYDSPYYTPLSSLVRSCMAAVPWLTLKFIYHATEGVNLINYHTRLRILDLAWFYHRRTFMGMMKEMEDLAQSRALGLDTPAMSRTFDALDGDEDMMQFLASIPGFYGSTEVEKDAQVLEYLNSTQLPSAIASFMDQSWSSGLLTGHLKERRIAICLKAITADPLLLRYTFRQTLRSMRSRIFDCVDFVLGVEPYNDDSDAWTKHYARCIIAVAINRIQEYNNSWSGIVQRQLGLSPSRFAEYRSQGDSVKFINFIRITQDLMSLHLNRTGQFEPGEICHSVLSEVRKFNAIGSVPELQHQFCNLWNDLVDKTQDLQGPFTARTNAIRILSLIRTAYLSLYQGTSSAPVAYSASTDDRDPVLLMETSYTRCTVEYRQRPILDAVVSILPSSAAKTTLPEPEPTPSVSQLPAVDDTHTDPGPLTLAMRKALPDDSRVRILVVGKTGSGKSSLINSITQTSTAAASHQEFVHDIETEHCSDDNPQLIFHESPGFPSWDETSLQTIQHFVTERTGAKRPESRRLDAIWICVSIPDATRRVEGGVEEILRIGKVPVVVVFTKYDDIIYTPQDNTNASDPENAQLTQLNLDDAHKQYRQLCHSLFNKDPENLPAVNVSVYPEHGNLIAELIKRTDKSIMHSRTERIPPEWSIKQSGSRGLEISASISVGEEKYWRSVWSSIDFEGQTLQDCLRTIHDNIINLWNLPDRSQYLSSENFKAETSHLVEEFVGLLAALSRTVLFSSDNSTAPAASSISVAGGRNPTPSMSEAYQNTQTIIPCMMSYMIDLTVILHELSRTIGNVTPHNVQFAVEDHVASGRRKRIHRAIRSFIVETPITKVMQEDVVIRRIAELAKRFLKSSVR